MYAFSIQATSHVCKNILTTHEHHQIIHATPKILVMALCCPSVERIETLDIFEHNLNFFLILGKYLSFDFRCTPSTEQYHIDSMQINYMFKLLLCYSPNNSLTSCYFFSNIFDPVTWTRKLFCKFFVLVFSTFIIC